MSSSGNSNFSGTQNVVPSAVQSLNVLTTLSATDLVNTNSSAESGLVTVSGVATIPNTTTAVAFAQFTNNGQAVQIPTGSTIVSAFVGPNNGVGFSSANTDNVSLGLGTVSGNPSPLFVLTGPVSSVNAGIANNLNGSTGPTSTRTYLKLLVSTGVTGGVARSIVSYVPPGYTPA